MTTHLFVNLGWFALGTEVARAIWGIVFMLREADMYKRLGGFAALLIYTACAVGIWGLLT